MSGWPTILEPPVGLPRSELAHHRALRVVPARAASLAFRVALPRDWRVGATVGEYVDAPWIQRPLAVFVGGEGAHDPRVTVATTLAPYEIRIADWVHQLFARSAWTVEHQRWHVLRTGARLVTVGRRGDRRRATVAFADGGRMFMAHCTTRMRDEAALARALWWTALTLHLERPGGPGHLEAHRRHALASVVTMLPWSWTTTSDRSRDAMLARPGGAVDDAPALTLRVGGPWVDDDSTLRAVLAQASTRGWTVARTITSPACLWPGRPHGWRLHDVQARAPWGGIRDVRIATGPCGSLAARVVIDGTAISDDPRAPPRQWWRACRALEIAVESLRRNTELA
jgi:hypothetical protein